MRKINKENEPVQNSSPKTENKKKWIILAVIAAVIVVVTCVLVFGNIGQKAEPITAKPIATATAEATQTPEPTKKVAISTTKQPSDRNDIDFDALAETNGDFVAWLSVPGTSIEYPIVYKADDNFYYLDVDFEGNESKHGAVYIDMGNNENMMDPVTVVYGHNMKDGTMFAPLHEFEDAAFFEEYDEIKVYMPDGMMVYKIIAAYDTGDDSILYGKDYTDAKVFQDYIDGIANNKDMGANIRDMEAGPGDKVLTLSTCVRGEDEKRYVVQGVLQKVQVAEGELLMGDQTLMETKGQ